MRPILAPANVFLHFESQAASDPPVPDWPPAPSGPEPSGHAEPSPTPAPDPPVPPLDTLASFDPSSERHAEKSTSDSARAAEPRRPASFVKFERGSADDTRS